MSRKWSREVAKNTKRVNELRSKSGQSPVGKDGAVRILGRSWIFPTVLAWLGFFFAVSMPRTVSEDPLYYITIALYFLLALFHYFARRPFLKIGKNELSWRTYTGEKFFPAGQIAAIHLGTKQSVVQLKNGKRRVFSRFNHIYPMERLNYELSKFAAQHRIPVNGEIKEIVDKA